MIIELNYAYTISDSKYDEFIDLIASKEGPNRTNGDTWTDFICLLEDSGFCSVNPLANRAMFIKVVQDVKKEKEKKEDIQNLSKSIQDSKNKVTAARKALEEAEQELARLQRLKSIACNN